MNVLINFERSGVVEHSDGSILRKIKAIIKPWKPGERNRLKEEKT